MLLLPVPVFVGEALRRDKGSDVEQARKKRE